MSQFPKGGGRCALCRSPKGDTAPIRRQNNNIPPLPSSISPGDTLSRGIHREDFVARPPQACRINDIVSRSYRGLAGLSGIILIERYYGYITEINWRSSHGEFGTVLSTVECIFRVVTIFAIFFCSFDRENVSYEFVWIDLLLRSKWPFVVFPFRWSFIIFFTVLYISLKRIFSGFKGLHDIRRIFSFCTEFRDFLTRLKN